MIPLLAGVAAVDALESTAGLRAGLKWPNDVLVDGAKLAGILAEVEPGGRGRGAVVVGLGLNLRVPTFPGAVHGISLHALVAEPPPWDTLLGAWLAALAEWLTRAETEGRGPLLEAWGAYAVGLGQRIRAETPRGMISGVASGVDGDGALLVDTITGVVRLVAGEVHLMTGPT